MGGPVGRAIEEAWALLDPDLRGEPLPSRPVLVVAVGVPLSGKSTLCRALGREAPTALALVENDALRARLATHLGRAAPLFDGLENHLTYRVAQVLLERALEAGASAVHDATNLDASQRRALARTAGERGADVVMLHVEASPEAIARRLDAVDEARREAHRKLGLKRPQPVAQAPHLALDGGAPVAENLGRLRAWAPMAPLFDA